ncbi:hypothetical protein GQ44DRAFT_827096 [Phaeosphaeriaceae sp. PMI808]|nr:hypothetical protein GQ44DRAFT_827096 [Phaeosphaeriaceae sp. PMI808]
MITEFLSHSTAGALFGAALASSGVYLPSVIVSQMQLAKFHMLKVFMTASAISALVFALFDRIGLSKTKPRPPSPLGVFSRYDGNILGGCMVGLGMTLTGACPGTALVQLSTGIGSARYVMTGCVLGGITYARLSEYLRKNQACDMVHSNLTLQSKFGFGTPYTVLSYEVLCLIFISLVMMLDPTQNPILLHPLLGGSLIGAAQAMALILTGNPVGVSTAYEVVGLFFWRIWRSLFGYDQKTAASLPLKSVFFAVGITVGALVRSQSIPLTDLDPDAGITAPRGVLGGFIMVLGARLAGGCTSGHGISGMSMFSISSFITVVSMFLGGFGSALLA